MYRLICIVREDVADGFRLAGIDVRVAQGPTDARQAIIDCLDTDDAGIIALDQRLATAVDERLERRLESLYRPVLVVLPLGETADVKALSQQRLQRLIRRAVGFDVTLKRE